MKAKLTWNEKQVLVLVFNRKMISVDDAMLVYRNKQYANEILKRLAQLDYLKILEFGRFIITQKGKEALGIEEDEKLTKFVKN